MTTPPEYLQHVPDNQLENLINQQSSILFECLDRAQGIAKAEDADLCSLNGLYFAYLRNEQYLAEMQRRFNERRQNARERVAAE